MSTKLTDEPGPAPENPPAVAAHTAGPWTPHRSNMVTIQGPDGAAIMQPLFPWSSRDGDAEYEANIALVCAAPELLDMIEAIVADAGTSGWWWGEKALELIAKAKGEKP